MQVTAIQLQLPWENSISPEEVSTPSIPIYTIGYGNRSMDQFLELLRRYHIEFLVDVRSQPYSRANQPFSRDGLEKTLKNCGMRYIFMGDTLGGRPRDESCYIDGRVNYLQVREKAFYQKGITHLRHAWERQTPVALMCAEIKPHECHRSKLIGNSLCELHIDVAHIDESGNLKQQGEINKLLLGDQLPLFHDQPPSTMLNERINLSRKKYVLPGERRYE